MIDQWFDSFSPQITYNCDICESEVNEVYMCENCNNNYCDDCSSVYNQHTQIDYNCCEPCSQRH